ncbi:AEC family transporter [Thermobifida halotolerans]|uniref:AEC family transporter n=1 Tax=Thermobifida halotolerans TaxID=483545 RepID=A0A399G5G3_9ACTN|nr:AEC family transporter [Thermobifida halotolerans]UOE21194.1 AEC family transporter [Thermobifida halotolerans]
MGVGPLLSTLVPLFAIVLIGYLASYFGSFQGNAQKAINDFVFYIALPALLFGAVVNSGLSDGISWAFIGANLTNLVIGSVIGLLGGLALFRRELPRALTTSMLAGYGNVAYLGVPLLVSAVGAQAALPVALGQLIHNMFFMVFYPLCVTLAVRRSRVVNAAKQRGRAEGAVAVEERSPAPGGESTGRAIFRSVVLNPVSLSVVAGLLFALLGLRLPGPVADTVEMLGGAAAPGALFAVGLTLRRAVTALQEGSVSPTELGFTVAVKLAVMPLVAVGLVTWVFSMPEVWAFTTVVMCGLPNAATAYVLAQQKESGAQQAAAAVVVTSVLSLITIPLVAVVA